MAARRLNPTNVFTPTRAPLREHNVYTQRPQAEHDLSTAVRRSEVPVVYGEFGVGKTTLVTRFFREEAMEGRFVHFLTPAGKNVEDLAEGCTREA